MNTRNTEMTLASQALLVINAQHGIQALTVEGGYGVDGNGDRFMLDQTPRVTKQKRNDAGRCMAATYQYSDGSVLEFKWSEQNGARYRLGQTVTEAENPSESPKASRPRPR